MAVFDITNNSLRFISAAELWVKFYKPKKSGDRGVYAALC